MADEPLAPPVPEDEDRQQAEGRRLVDRVDDLLQQGKPQAARSVLARNWQDAAPDLPLRYPLVLESLSSRFAGQLARYLRLGGAPPALDLELVGKQSFRGQVMVAGRRLGDLPREQANYLGSLGADAAVYRPRLLSMRTTPAGEVEAVEIEMARPELRRCSSCGRLHDEVEQVNCADCRQARRRKDPERAEPEASPVALHEAIDAALAEPPAKAETKPDGKPDTDKA